MEYQTKDVKDIINIIDKIEDHNPIKIMIQKLIEDYNKLYGEYELIRTDRNRYIGLVNENLKIKQEIKDKKKMIKKLSGRMEMYIIENKKLKDALKDLKNKMGGTNE